MALGSSSANPRSDDINIILKTPRVKRAGGYFGEVGLLCDYAGKDCSPGKPRQTTPNQSNPVKPTKTHRKPPKPSISRVGVSLAVFCLNIEKKKKRQNIDKKVKIRAETGCMVILGFAGFGWVLGGCGGFGFVGLVWWDLGAMVGLWVCGAGCTCTGRKRGFVWVFWWEFGAGWALVGNLPREVV